MKSFSVHWYTAVSAEFDFRDYIIIIITNIDDNAIFNEDLIEKNPIYRTTINPHQTFDIIQIKIIKYY